MATGDILIVEDERIIAHDLRKELEVFGYTVCGIAASGLDALRLAEEGRPDLVLMDINIKGNLDGVEVAKELKNRFNLPVVYLTGYADERTLERAKETEPAGYLVKPFNQREVRAAIELVLGRRQGALLRHREAWFGKILNSIADGVLVVRDDGVIQYINPAAERLLGWQAGEIIGKHIETTLEFQNSPNILETLERNALRWGITYEDTIGTKDGGEVRAQFTVSRSLHNEVPGPEYVLVLRDGAKV